MKIGSGAVDFHRCIGHHAFQHDEDAPFAPVLRDIKTMPVFALDGRVIFIFVAVTEISEALQFPARRHGDVRPNAAMASVGAEKIP